MTDTVPLSEYLKGWKFTKGPNGELLAWEPGDAPKSSFVRKPSPVKNMHAELQLDGESIVWFEESDE
jgi:hypothetical protein